MESRSSLNPEIQSFPNQQVHGFGSFEGLPESWGTEPRGSDPTPGSLPAVPGIKTLRAGVTLILLAALCAVRPPALAADARSAFRDADAEAGLHRILAAMAGSRLTEALAEADRLVSDHPTFRLGHLVRGDVLLARTGVIGALGAAAAPMPERMAELRAEALARVSARREAPPPNTLPDSLLQLAPEHRNVVVVDASRSRLYVFENARNRLRLAAHYYTSLGKQGVDKLKEGDQRTPLGIYHVTSRLPGVKLPDLYGWGAFPINYPNAWDRLQGRTGYGIWLHGVPSDTYARAPWASDGCVALANSDIEELSSRIDAGKTPVVISDRLNWVSTEALAANRSAFLRKLESWRKDWESRDAVRYLSHYAPSFRSGAMNLARWSDHKRKVNAGKRWIKVGLGNVSVLRSPGRSGPIAVTFDQDYRSSSFS